MYITVDSASEVFIFAAIFSVLLKVLKLQATTSPSDVFWSGDLREPKNDLGASPFFQLSNEYIGHSKLAV